ncbi:MAG: clostripain-related cysteine peptidase [Rikenellaceae bacterium]|nr:clostripain-related cysteine peptidase [Rikenellaceae bacterium]
MKNFYYIIKNALIVSLIAVTVVACRKDDYNDVVEERVSGGKTADSSSRTVLVYMAAENSLNDYAYNNIAEMMAGIEAVSHLTGKNNIIVYLDPAKADSSDPVAGNVPRLIHITTDNNGKARKDILKYYEESDSSSPEVMRSVIYEVCNKFPAEQYGLILWSHGMGWAPYEDDLMNYWIYGSQTSAQISYGLQNPLYDDGLPMTKAFGQDGNNWMTNQDMVDAIPSNLFDFIIFDACFMGSVEVLYELRDKADYFISSVAEILAEGFPYLYIMDLLLTPGNNYQEICEAYFEFYANHDKGGSYRSATVSLVQSSELENLAFAVRNVVQADRDRAVNVDLSSVQRYDRYNNKIIYDLGDYIEKISASAEYEVFTSALDRAVLYKAHTTSFLNFTINTHSGLSVYIPAPDYEQYITPYYIQLPWYDAVWR